MQYPNLHRMALDYLCVPGSGVSVERLFSKGTDVVTPRRQSLSSEMIKQVMCLKGWLKSADQALFRKEMSESIVAKMLGGDVE